MSEMKQGFVSKSDSAGVVNPVLASYRRAWEELESEPHERLLVERIAANMLALRLNSHYGDGDDEVGDWERYSDECVTYMEHAHAVFSRLLRLRGLDSRPLEAHSEVVYPPQVPGPYTSNRSSANPNPHLLIYRNLVKSLGRDMEQRQLMERMQLRVCTGMLDSHRFYGEDDWVEYTDTTVAQLEHAIKVYSRMVSLHEGTDNVEPVGGSES